MPVPKEVIVSQVRVHWWWWPIWTLLRVAIFTAKNTTVKKEQYQKGRKYQSTLLILIILSLKISSQALTSKLRSIVMHCPNIFANISFKKHLKRLSFDKYHESDGAPSKNMRNQQITTPALYIPRITLRTFRRKPVVSLFRWMCHTHAYQKNQKHYTPLRFSIQLLCSKKMLKRF